MWGRFEHEIRLLPQVVAVTVTPHDVVVLVEPGADAHAVAAAVHAVAEESGARQHIRVVGGMEPIAPRLAPSGRRWLLVGGAAAASLAVALGQLVGSGGRIAPTPRAIAPNVPARDPARPSGSAAAADTAPAIAPHRGPHISAPAPVLPVIPVVPISIPPVRLRPTPKPSPTPPPVVVIVETPPACPGPPDRNAPRDQNRRGRGNGPPAWSRSILVEPHDTCEHGRD